MTDYPERLERHKQAYDRHAGGETYGSIARDMGITPARAGQMARRWARHLEMQVAPVIDARSPMADLRLPDRVYAALKRHGLSAVGDLLAMDEESLLAVGGFGHAGLMAVIKALAAHGLSLTAHRHTVSPVMVFIGAEQYSRVRALAARAGTTVETQIERLIDCAAKSSEASGDVQPGR